MVSTMVGLIVMVISVWGMIHWYRDLAAVLRGLMPLSFFFGGLVALIAGISSMQDVKGKKAPAADKKTQAS